MSKQIVHTEGIEEAAACLFPSIIPWQVKLRIYGIVSSVSKILGEAEQEKKPAR